MIDLSTDYLGLHLRNPLVVSPSPLCQELDNLRRMEDAGAAAIVLHSLFQEQIDADRLGGDTHAAESQRKQYLSYLSRAKANSHIPILASLNGFSARSWDTLAEQIESSGADALELNVYGVATDPWADAGELERHYIDVLIAIHEQTRLPLALKLSPFFTSLPNVAMKLTDAGADALVLFNRFYQPDFFVSNSSIVPCPTLSTSQELPLRLYWVSVLSGIAGVELAVTGGVHTAEDVLKSVMAGARVAMMTSALLLHGIGYLATVERHLRELLAEYQYDSIDQVRGAMNRHAITDPVAFDRAMYMQQLHGFNTPDRESKTAAPSGAI